MSCGAPPWQTPEPVQLAGPPSCLALGTRHWDIVGPHSQESDAGTLFPEISMLVTVRYSGLVSRTEPVPAATPQPGQLLVTGQGARGLDIGAADISELSL